MRLELHPEAQTELRSAALWYEERRPGLGKATIQRFPYVIAFEKHEQHVLVLAVAHAKRRPLYWLTRTNP